MSAKKRKKVECKISCFGLTPRPRAAFVIRRLPALRDGKRLGAFNTPLVLKVRLVTGDDYWDTLVVLNTDNLLAEIY